MSEQSLVALLRALQSPSSSFDDVSRLLTFATDLLIALTNPLNVTTLTTQLLVSPGIWAPAQIHLDIPLRILTAFHAATQQKAASQARDANLPRSERQSTLPLQAWLQAVTAGVDARVEGWKQALLMTSLLTGLERDAPHIGGLSLLQEREAAAVAAINGALEEMIQRDIDEIAQGSICLAAGHAFDLLSPPPRLALNLDRLLSVLIRTIYQSPNGFHAGYFLSPIDADLRQTADNRFQWPARSASFIHMQNLTTGPLMSLLGPLSRLIAFCVEHTRDPAVVSVATHDLLVFTRSVQIQWRQNRLSELDGADEAAILAPETQKITVPVLWQTLKSVLFSTIVMLAASTARLLRNGYIAKAAPHVAIEHLQILRNLYFILSRLGALSFSHFTFVYSAAVDMLVTDRVALESFLLQARPDPVDQVPEHPHDRALALFYLNTVEQVTGALGPESNDDLALRVALPYLSAAQDPRLRELYEAAHSVMLAVFATPRNHALAQRMLPFYVDCVMQAFPSALTSRQFRLAIRTVVHIASPPSPIAQSDPVLAPTILELVRHRTLAAASTDRRLHVEGYPQRLSEQTVLMLALLDALPALPPPLLQDWLTLAAETLQAVKDPEMQGMCRARFWELLTSGELDIRQSERAAVWWTTRGGHAWVMEGQRPVMSEHLVT